MVLSRALSTAGRVLRKDTVPFRAPFRSPFARVFSSLSFEAAAELVKRLPSPPSDGDKLQLYAFFKQATTGPVTGSKPSMWDMVASAKYEAHAALRDMPKEAAAAAYVARVSALAGHDAVAAATASKPSAPTTPSVSSSSAVGPAGAFASIKRGAMLPPGSFAGRVAFITGGGTGLGRAMATTLATLGATVAISSRKGDVLDAAAKEMRASIPGSRIIPVPADVREAGAIAAALDVVERETGSLATLIVNNAAGNFISPYERLSPNAVKTVIDIVLTGTALVTLEAGKRLIAAKQGGTFLQITTTYAPDGSGFVVPSAMAKAGVHAMTKSLAAEWGRYGIRFVAIAPGPIETEGAFSRLDPTGAFKALSMARLPAKRLGEREELANLASYLLSDYASWMTGEVVTLDGGEKPAMSGEFNELHRVTPAQWDALEAQIRKTNKK